MRSQRVRSPFVLVAALAVLVGITVPLTIPSSADIRASGDSAGTNIGNATQITGSASGSLASAAADDWWVIYPAAVGGTVSIKVDNTTATSSTCGYIAVSLDATNGSGDALQSPVLSPSTSDTVSGSQSGSDRYFIEVTTTCNPPAPGPASYTLTLESGGGGIAPSPSAGSISAGTNIGNAWPPLQGNTTNTGSLTSSSSDAWYALYKDSDTNPATIRVENTTVLDSSMCTYLSVTLDANDGSGDAIQSPVLDNNSAVTFNVPAEASTDPTGLYYLELTNDGCTLGGTVTYSITPEPSAEFENPAKVPSGSISAGTNIGNAWPPLQGNTTNTGSLTSSSSDAWYALYKDSDTNPATIRVENTTVLDSSMCTYLSVTLDANDGSGDAIQSPVLDNNSAVTFNVPAEASTDPTGLYYLELTNDGCTLGGTVTYSITPEPSAEFENPAQPPSGALPTGPSMESAGGPLAGGQDYFSTVSSPTANNWDEFVDNGKVPTVNVTVENTSSRQSTCPYVAFTLENATGDAIGSPVLATDSADTFELDTAGTYYLEANDEDCNWGSSPAPTYEENLAPGDGFTPQSQTITFTSSPPATSDVGGTYQVSATASSGLPVTLSIDASSTSVCSISGSTSGSTVTFNATGTCVIDANQAGNSTYTPAAQVSQSVVVNESPTSAALENLGGGDPSAAHPTTCSCADPVETASGDLWETFGDMAISGRGEALALSDTYNALTASVNGPLGYGWTDSYDLALTASASGSMTFTQGNGSSVVFSDSAGTYSPPTWVQASLVHNSNGTWTLTEDKREVLTFNASGMLTSEADLDGNTTTLSYNSNATLATVTDPAGRTLSFTYSGSHISSISDSAGTVSFSYDSVGDLASYTNITGGTWQFTYDSSHRLLQMTDPLGRITKNKYQSSGQVKQQADPLGRKTKFAYSGNNYSAAGGTTSVTDPLGVVTEYHYVSGELTSVTQASGTSTAATYKYTYDPSSHGITKETDPDGHTTSATYDGQGNQLSSTDALGRTTAYTYNALNEATSVTDPLGTKTTYTYDSRGNLLSVSTPSAAGTVTSTYTHGNSSHPGDITSATNPDGNSWSYAYDAAGDLTSVTDPLGKATAATYDSIGRQLSVTNPAGHTTSATYDSYGDPLTVTDPDGHVTKYSYDADHELVSTTDPLGDSTGTSYDADGEATKQSAANGSSTSDSYDADGRVISSTNADDQTAQYSYDALGDLVSSTDPLDKVTTYTYDLAGNETSETNAKGKKSSYTYDADDERIGITYSGTSTHAVTYTYNADGDRTSMLDGTGTTTYSYDSLGDLTSSKNGAGATVGYGYDLAGNLTTLTYPGSQVVTYAYDKDERPASITDWNGNKTTYAYNTDSDLTAEDYPNGVDATYSYDAAANLTALKDVAGTNTLASFSYSYNADSDVTSQTSSSGTQSLSYDPLQDLLTDGPSSYGYDPAGNLTSMSGPAAQSLTDKSTTSATLKYNADDELTSATGASPSTWSATYSYDALGERTKSSAPEGTTKYSYDEAGDLTGLSSSSVTATYGYNGDGLRTSKSVTEGATTQKSSFVYSLVGGAPKVLSDGTNTYVYGPNGAPVEQIAGSGTIDYLHQDDLGSTVLITNATGATAATFSYDAYGNLTSSTGSVSTPLGYTGAYTDEESGLLYLVNRYYDPATAQFLTVDPALALTGTPYAYAGDDPSNVTDPDGMDPQTLYGYISNTDDEPPPGSFCASPAAQAAAIAAGVVIVGAALVAAAAITIVAAPFVAGLLLDAAEVGILGGSEIGSLATGATLEPAATELAAIDAAGAEGALDAAGAEGALPDSTAIVRGGQSDLPPPGEVFSGSQGQTLDEAAQGVPHGTIRSTTAGEIRASGGTVERNPEFNANVGRTNYQHVDVCLGEGPCPFGEPQPNPIPKSGRFGGPDYPYAEWEP